MDAGLLKQHLDAQGLSAASVSDGDAVSWVIYNLGQWYNGLDGVSRAIVDALSASGCGHLLADPQVNVASGGDEFLRALDSTGWTLGQWLPSAATALASAQAAEQAGPGTTEMA